MFIVICWNISDKDEITDIETDESMDSQEAAYDGASMNDGVVPDYDADGTTKINWLKMRLKYYETKLNELHNKTTDMAGLKAWNDILKKMKIQEISYRDDDMSGTHSLLFLNRAQDLVDGLKEYSDQGKALGDILEKILHFRRFIIHSCCHKNRVRYSDDFIKLFLFAVIMDDHLTRLYVKMCYGQKKYYCYGQKQHCFYHIYWWMDYYRWSPAWVDDQKSENVMKLLKRMFRKMNYSLSQSKLRSLCHQMNLCHYVVLDTSNSR